MGLVVPNALGFLLGIAPLVAWLFAHGLFEPFRQATLINGHVFNLLLSYLLPAIAAGKLITALAIAGGLLLVEMQRERPAGPWPPGNALLAAALLAWLVPILEPNHLAYNLQMFAMPAAVLGTVLMVKLAEPAAGRGGCSSACSRWPWCTLAQAPPCKASRRRAPWPGRSPWPTSRT